jgi:hypothetical protein
MSRARRLPSLSRLLAVLVAAVLATAVMPASPASAKKVRIDPRIFGVHDTTLGSFGHGAGSLRLWDAGTTWRDIETSPGVYDFSRLDAIVNAAQARNIEVTLVLGMTPSFYASAPTAMPGDMGAWTRYIQAVVNRYKSWNGRRGIGAYQVWNEANVKNFWTGSPVQMATMTKAAWNAVKGADSGATVVGPAFAARIAEQTRGIGFFFNIRISGVPIWKYMNAIGLNLYPLEKYGSKLGTPEKSMSLLAAARKQLRLRGVPAGKKIWNTEVNYGMRGGTYGGTKAIEISPTMQASYVIRTYLLNASQKVKRVHWYSWDMGYLPGGGTLGTTRLTNPADQTSVTLAGKAFGLVRGWMQGGTMVGPTKAALPCTKDRAGTYTCVIKYGKGVKRVYWNPTKRVRITTAKSATFLVNVYGKRKAVRGGARKAVNFKPLMVRSKF